MLERTLALGPVIAERARVFRRHSAATIIRGVLVVGIGVMAITTPGFLTLGTLASIFDFAAPMGLVAIGMCFITISGQIMALSLGAILSVTAIIFLAATALCPTVVAAMLAIVIGAGLSGLQGAIIGTLRANSIIVSIAALALLTGLTTQLTGGASLQAAPGSDLNFLRFHVGPVDALVVAFVLGTIGADFILRRTSFGRAVYLVGSNDRAAEAAGIKVHGVIFWVYAIAGGFSGLAGVLMAARLRLASMETGLGYDYDAITAVLIGGTAMHGGRGSAWRTFAGALILAGFTTMLVLRGYGQDVQRVLAGLLVLAVMCLQKPAEQR